MSAPAPVTARVRGQARFEAGTLLRNGEQLLVSVVLPLGALVGLALTSVPSLGDGRRIDVATPGVLALCVISAAFTSQAIATGFDRRASVLPRSPQPVMIGRIEVQHCVLATLAPLLEHRLELGVVRAEPLAAVGGRASRSPQAVGAVRTAATKPSAAACSASRRNTR